MGLNENIIIGHLIPAGSGIYRYSEIEIEPPAGFEPPPPHLLARSRGGRAQFVPQEPVGTKLDVG